MFTTAIQWSVNAIYKCSGAKELTKFYHATLGSHPKSSLIAAAKAGYLKGFLGFTQERIHKQIYQNRGSNGSRSLEEDARGHEVNHDPV